MHDEPNLPNYVMRDARRGCKKAWSCRGADGECGKPEVRMRDEWVAETADGSPSAHFEHTVAITANVLGFLTRQRK